MVLLPLGDKVTVSQKIRMKEERTRLRKLIMSIKSPMYGLIIRTVAEDKQAAELDSELKFMEKRWLKAVAALRRSKGITMLYEESSRTVSVLRDFFTPDYQAIHVDSPTIYEEVKAYVELIAPELTNIVRLYNDTTPIYDHFAITRQVKSLFGRTVSFKRGAYLILDKTEAMHVIDVNSGTRTKADQTQEENALEVNIAAGTEIARQLRLRDMGGIIVIDFIDMAVAANRNALYDHMCKEMSTDRARHNILPLSKFGLMQITRQRVRPAMEIETKEVCPTCHGTGKSRASILLVDEIEEHFDDIKETYKVKNFVIEVNPYVAAYIKRGFPSILTRWRLRHGIGLRLRESQTLGMLEYRFTDPSGDEYILRGASDTPVEKHT